MGARGACAALVGSALAGTALAAMVTAAAAQEAGPPKLEPLEAYVNEVTRPATLDIKDPMAVLAFVLNSLPERVNVYPTENYYYFNFYYGGGPYAGNIRIEPADDGTATVHFVYYEDWSEWRQDSPLVHVVLDASKGVTVEKLDRLVYRLTYRGKSVVFALNDLSQVKPPDGVLAPGETYIGPIFDESAIRFFLVYNPKLKTFHYILDETVKVAEDFLADVRHDRILIGKRTGFAFYKDRLRDRKILIGVYEANFRLNTHFDGPFDQLPDNFIEGEVLRKAILEVDPSLKGKIDRFGGIVASEGALRYEIKPYASYRTVSDLYDVDKCATSRLHRASYYTCFVAEEEDEGVGPRPARTRAANVRKKKER
jgi:hypothetical protein